MSIVDHIRSLLAKIDFQDIVIFLLVLAALSVISRLLKGLATLCTKKFPKKRMLFLAWVPVLNFILYFAGLLMASFIIFQPTQEVTIGFFASLLIAIGFAIKDIAASIISGIILLIDKPFQVGDRITFQSVYGEIISIGLRSIKILTLDQNIVTIPNNRFMNDWVSSSNAGELGMMATVAIYISPDTNIAQAKEVLENCARTISFVDTNKKIIVVCKEILAISGVISIEMKAKCIIKDARTEQAFQTEFIIMVNSEFKKQAIK